MNGKKQKHTAAHYVITILVYFVKYIIVEFIWLLVGIGGYFIFNARVSPYNLLIGVPLIVISASFIINSIFSQFLSFFSPKYNKAVCVLCDI